MHHWHISETDDGRYIKTWMTRTRRSGFLIAVRRCYIKLRRHRRLLTIKKSVIKDHRPIEAGRVRRFRRWNVLLGLRSTLPDGIAKELGLPDWPPSQCPAKLPPREATASLQHYGPERPPLLKPQGTSHRQKMTVKARHSVARLAAVEEATGSDADVTAMEATVHDVGRFCAAPLRCQGLSSPR